jgi:hypothetical protein
MKTRSFNAGKFRAKIAILAGGLLGSFVLVAQAATYLTGFETGEGYVALPGTGPTSILAGGNNQQGWVEQFGGDNFSVFPYAGNQVPYTPAGDVPVIGGIPQLVTIPQNPTGGGNFAALGGNNGRDMHAADYTPGGGGFVEISVDYHPGDWFDNGGNYNGGFLIRPSNTGGFYTGLGSSAATENGPWAPQFRVSDIAGTAIPTTIGLGHRFDGVACFDDLSRSIWHRIGMVYDEATGLVTQMKSQELTPGGAITIMNSPQVGGVDIYVQPGGPVDTYIGIYNVGNGTISAYDNVYVGAPYTWEAVAVIPEPSIAGLLAAAFGLTFIRRRRK